MVKEIQKHIAFIFDMDGVLVDNLRFHLQAWTEFCKKYGIHLTSEEFHTKMFGGSNRDLLERVFGKKLQDSEIRQLSEEKEQLYRDLHAPEIKPYGGVKEFLRSLKANEFRTALATAAPRTNVDFVMSATGMRDLFDVILDESNVTRGKPDPEVYLQTARMLDMHPSSCIVFEDSLTGIKAAKAAGMRVIGVASSLPPEKLDHTWKVIREFTEIDVEKLKEELKEI